MNAVHSTRGGHSTESRIRPGDRPSVPTFSLIPPSYDLSGLNKSEESERKLNAATFGRSPDRIQQCCWMSTDRRWLQCRDCGGLSRGNSRRLGRGKGCRLQRRNWRRLERRHLWQEKVGGEVAKLRVRVLKLQEVINLPHPWSRMLYNGQTKNP